MKDFKTYLEKSSVVILDGGMSTALEEKGLTMSNPVWNGIGLIAAPSLVKKAHQNFFEAGANICITNTYFCSSLTFQPLGFTRDEVKGYLQKSVQLVKAAREEAEADHEMFVGGSISCYGVHYSNLSEYTGDYTQTEAEYRKHHKEKFEVFSEEGVDLLVMEAIPNFEETKILLDMLTEYPNLIGYMSNTLDDGQHLGDGTPYAKLQPLLEDHPQIVAYGSNCVSPTIMDEFISYATKQATKPLVAYPNGFSEYDPVAKEFVGDMVDFDRLFTEKAEAWIKQGVKIIGGCCGCGTSPITSLKQAVKN